MKKVFLTAVAVVALSFPSKADANNYVVFNNCFQEAIDTYDAVFAATGSKLKASHAADIVYDRCNKR